MFLKRSLLPICMIWGPVKSTARRDVRARAPGTAEVVHAGTDAGVGGRDGRELGPLGRQGDRQRSARDGDGGGRRSIHLVANSHFASRIPTRLQAVKAAGLAPLTAIQPSLDSRNY